MIVIVNIKLCIFYHTKKAKIKITYLLKEVLWIWPSLNILTIYTSPLSIHLHLGPPEPNKNNAESVHLSARASWPSCLVSLQIITLWTLRGVLPCFLGAGHTHVALFGPCLFFQVITPKMRKILPPRFCFYHNTHNIFFIKGKYTRHLTPSL